VPAAVIFDLDGVLVDSERLWNQAKEAYVREAGGEWNDAAPTDMIGMSSPEWSGYLRDTLSVPREPVEINQAVVARMEATYRERLPLLPRAVETVTALAERWLLGLASSANREIIDLFLELAELRWAFGTVVSSEEVARGKPSPDVYLEAARRLGVAPAKCVAIEDSSNGIRAAAAAGMAVIAVPNPDYPPAEDALALAAASVKVVAQVTPALVERVERTRSGP
jgi:HAD superfamily hydrolase (TIGR01509 family)